ncbi:MAG: carbohydrate kinase family protein [Clostridia bacterium]|nr:carbohydrate kinase family protein [Clostridia bacterium]
MSFIAGAGITNVDLLYQNMPKIPDVGEEVYTDRFSLQLGGGLPATLINLGRLGVPTKLATELGKDLFSAFALEQFRNSHVLPMNLYHGEEIPLNITSAVILPHDRSFITYGKNAMQPDLQAKKEFYHMATGAKLCLMSPGGFADVYRVLKEEGTVLVLDMGWDDDLSFDRYGDVLSLADYYTPNRKEALKLTGCSDPREAALALRQYFDKVVVKVDRDGCIGIDEGGMFFCKSLDMFQPVDSTGAGDAFLAGFCYGLFHDASFRDCIAFGNITGGKAVTAVGALSAYVTEAELLTIRKGMDAPRPI